MKIAASDKAIKETKETKETKGTKETGEAGTMEITVAAGTTGATVAAGANEAAEAKTLKKPVPKKRKKAEKKADCKISQVFEAHGLQVAIDVDDVIGKIKADIRSYGEDPEKISSLCVYYNLHEHRAYYVVDGVEDHRSVGF